jgi:hypothetical protein
MRGTVPAALDGRQGERPADMAGGEAGRGRLPLDVLGDSDNLPERERRGVPFNG